MHLKAPSELNPTTLDETFAQLDLPWRVSGPEWIAPADRLTALLLDLSHLRFARLDALAQLVITIQALVLDGATIHVRPPSNSNAARFVTSSGFYNVLKKSPDNEFHLLGLEPDKSRPSRYYRFFPLHWLQGHMSSRTWIRHVLTREVGAQKWLPEREVAQITNAILDELIENVGAHSGRKSALVGIVADSSERRATTTEFSLSERPAFLATRALRRASLRLVVADAGVGVLRQLGSQRPDASEEQILAFAFDRWSSSVDPSPQRGTRGLYRVGGVDEGRSGYTTLRSGCGAATEHAESLSGGRPCPTESTTVFPGTLIRIDIPLSVDSRPVTRGVGFQRELQFFRVGASSAHSRDALLHAARKAHSNKAILIVDVGSIKNRVTAEALIIDLAELSHPTLTAVLNCPVSDAQLENFADSVNNQVHRLQDESDHHRVFEPVLLVGTRLDITAWAGLSPTLGGQLNDLAMGGSVSSSILSSQYFGRQHSEEYLVLSKETLFRSTREYFQKQAQLLVHQASPGMTFCTSSLALVHGYIDVPTLLAKTKPAQELLFRCMIEQVRRATRPNAIDEAILLYEEGIPDDAARRFATLLRGGDSIPTANVQPITKRDLDQGRTFSAPRDSEVLILGKLIAEGHTARHLAAFVMRQGYSLIGVMAFVDAGTGSNTMELWGEPFPRMAATTMALVVNDADGKLTFLDGEGNAERTQVTQSLSSFTRVIDEAAQRNALYLGHYVGDRDRHFTFVVSAQDYLSTGHAPEALNRLLHTIGSTCKRGQIARICYGVDNWPGRPSRRLAGLVVERCALKFPPLGLFTITPRRARSSSAESTFVFVVWVAISGSSIYQILNRMSTLGAEAVEIHVLLSQLPNETEQLLASLQIVATGAGRPMSVQVVFYGHLPFASFEPRACPMCLQRPGEWSGTAVDGNKQPSESHRDFLALRPWAAVPSVAHDVFAQVHGSTEYRQRDAAKRRAELLLAARSTQGAWELRQRWIADDTVVPSVAALLLYEPQWLRQEPLANDATRTWLAGRLVQLLTLAPGRSSAEQIRLLRSLRLVAKTALCRHVPDIVRAIVGQPETLAVLATQVAEICERPYLRGSGLLRDLAAGLREAAAEAAVTPASQEVIGTIDEMVRVANRAATSASRASLPIATARRELLDALDRFEGHIVGEPYRDCLKYEDVEKCLDGWMSVQRWARLDFAGSYDRFYHHLILTSFLTDAPAASAIFDPQNGAKPISDIVQSLVKIKANGGKIDGSLAARMERVKAHLDELLVSPDGHASSLMRLAIGAVGTTLSDIVAQLNVVCRSPSRKVESRVEAAHVPLWMPDRVAESVARIVGGNMLLHAGPEAWLEVSASQDKRYPMHQCIAFVTRPVDVQPRPLHKPGRGGLKELVDEIPSQVGFLEHGPVEDGYAVFVYIRTHLEDAREER